MMVTQELRVDMRKLSPAAREALRMRVMAAIGDGRSDAEAANLFGVSTKSIGRWRAHLDADGAEGLRSGTPGRKTGTHRFLTKSEEAALKQTILEFTPDDLGLGGLLWTTPKVHAFLQRHFKVRYSHGGLIKLFRRLGLSFQRPDRRAREANREVIREWTETTDPAIRAKAKDDDAVIMFADQVGARSDHLSGRTWSAKGNTPVVARTGKRFGMNAMSAISTRGRMYFTIFEDRFNADTCIALLAKLIGHFKGQKIHLVLDGHSIHKCRAVREWVAKHKGSIELHFLPAYAPHLNPDELVNADLKRQLVDRVITERPELVVEVRSILRSIQKLPARIMGYFEARYTKYASDTI